MFAPDCEVLNCHRITNGHCFPNYHMKNIRNVENDKWRFNQVSTEMEKHILSICKKIASARQRVTHLGKATIIFRNLIDIAFRVSELLWKPENHSEKTSKGKIKYIHMVAFSEVDWEANMPSINNK